MPPRAWPLKSELVAAPAQDGGHAVVLPAISQEAGLIFQHLRVTGKVGVNETCCVFARHAVLLIPFMPGKSQELWRQVGGPGDVSAQLAKAQTG